MKKQMTVVVTGLVLLFGGIFGFLQVKQYFIDAYLADYTPPPVTISAEAVEQQVWENVIKAIGTLKAVSGVDITTQVGGLIQEVYFASGLDVEEGQILVQLDDSVEQANLRSYDAQMQLAKINFNRDKKLLASRAISKTDFDTVEAKLKDAQAQVERTTAQIQQKQIRAPFSGRLGIRLLNVGDYVNSGDKLVTLQALDYLHIDFYVPEQYFPKLHVGQQVRFIVQAFEGRTFQATVSAINAKIDEDTRNILVRATFNNDAQELLPGMFANMDVILDAEVAVITVPQTAISYSLYGNSVFVVTASGEDNEAGDIHTVERRYISVADRKGDQVAIVEGVEPGEMVVTSGQLKLNNGARVLINNDAKL